MVVYAIQAIAATYDIERGPTLMQPEVSPQATDGRDNAFGICLSKRISYVVHLMFGVF